MNDLRKLYGFVKRVYGHFFIRPFQRYNTDERAFKLLDKMQVSNKPIVTAPKHKPTRAYLEQLIKGKSRGSHHPSGNTDKKLSYRAP